MTPDEQEENALQVVDLARRAFRRTAEQLIAKGVQLEDCAIGMAYATQDIAAEHKGDHHAAIEWLRTANDLQELQLLNRKAGLQ